MFDKFRGDRQFTANTGRWSACVDIVVMLAHFSMDFTNVHVGVLLILAMTLISVDKVVVVVVVTVVLVRVLVIEVIIGLMIFVSCVEAVAASLKLVNRRANDNDGDVISLANNGRSVGRSRVASCCC